MKASPTERHFAAKSWNWDYGEAPIIWISRQSDTDIATAITIFFLCEPSYYQKFAGDLEAVSSEHQRFQLKLILEIKMKIDQGFYSNSNIQLNLSREIGSIEEYRKKISQNQHTYPVTLKEIYDGIKMSEIKLNIPNFGIS